MRYVLESRRDEEYSEKKIIKIRPQIKNRQGGGQNHPPLGQPPNLKDVNIPRVNYNIRWIQGVSTTLKRITNGKAKAKHFV